MLSEIALFIQEEVENLSVFKSLPTIVFSGLVSIFVDEKSLANRFGSFSIDKI